MTTLQLSASFEARLAAYETATARRLGRIDNAAPLLAALELMASAMKKGRKS